ncbi:conjugal transfer protein TraX [Leclercia adecarboxylata]|nr:conjugal transfer protein TraX [Leclercia adecarboxylata]
MATTFAAPLVGLWLLRQKITQHIWPVGRWGYYFYPGHLAVLALFRAAL